MERSLSSAVERRVLGLGCVGSLWIRVLGRDGDRDRSRDRDPSLVPWAGGHSHSSDKGTAVTWCLQGF